MLKAIALLPAVIFGHLRSGDPQLKSSNSMLGRKFLVAQDHQQLKDTCQDFGGLNCELLTASCRQGAKFSERQDKIGRRR